MKDGRTALLKTLMIAVLTGILWMPVSVYAEETASQETAAQETQNFREQAQAIWAGEDSIAEGIRLDSQDVSGLTKEEAVNTMIAYAAKCGENPITFYVNGQAVSAPMSDFRLGFGQQGAVDTALAYGKTGSLIQRYQEIRTAAEEGVTIPANLSYDQDALRSFLKEGVQKYEEPAVNAKVYLENGQIRIEPEQTGTAADCETALTEAAEILASWDGGPVNVTVQMKEDKPEVTEAALKEQVIGTEVLGTFETSFTWVDGEDRAENLKVACDKINGWAFLPGQEISANDMMAPVTEEGGYRTGHAFQDGQTVDSIGGGICQVSTTLYNVGLLAELQITHRSSHSMQVSYVDPSMDATVFPESGLDLTMVNNTGNVVFFEAERSNEKVVITLYGTEYRPENREVKYVSKTISAEYPDPQYELIYDDSIPVGEYEDVEWLRPKMTAELWKEVYVDGQLTENVQVNKSSYNWSTGVRKVHSGCGFDGKPVS